MTQAEEVGVAMVVLHLSENSSTHRELMILWYNTEYIIIDKNLSEEHLFGVAMGTAFTDGAHMDVTKSLVDVEDDVFVLGPVYSGPWTSQPPT